MLNFTRNIQKTLFKHFSIIDNYKNYHEVYTDASKTHDEVGISIIFTNKNILFKLSIKCSIFTAEAIAILEAIKIIFNEKHSKYFILSNFLSTYQ